MPTGALLLELALGFLCLCAGLLHFLCDLLELRGHLRHPFLGICHQLPALLQHLCCILLFLFALAELFTTFTALFFELTDLLIGLHLLLAQKSCFRLSYFHHLFDLSQLLLQRHQLLLLRLLGGSKLLSFSLEPLVELLQLRCLTGSETFGAFQFLLPDRCIVAELLRVLDQLLGSFLLFFRSLRQFLDLLLLKGNVFSVLHILSFELLKVLRFLFHFAFDGVVVLQVVVVLCFNALHLFLERLHLLLVFLHMSLEHLVFILQRSQVALALPNLRLSQ
mmetsp:Transcript_68442/g.107611  ORF Transcript_68442/g.107611 Transcript_68442/m.107611 type:complete len:278 (+) Transcript_68442:2338-3171(+)